MARAWGRRLNQAILRHKESDVILFDYSVNKLRNITNLAHVEVHDLETSFFAYIIRKPDQVDQYSD